MKKIALLAILTLAQSRVDQTLATVDHVFVNLNVPYRTVGSWTGHLDIYPQPKKAPVVIYFHGGGWVGGSKEGEQLQLLPFIAMGYSVVTVEYRLGVAPAAIEDARCSMSWVRQHGSEYGFDLSRVMLAGLSAGAHIALLAGMVTPDAGFDACDVGDLKVVAVLSISGVSDLPALMSDESALAQPYAVAWVGNTDPVRLSPVTYINRDTPPIFSIAGESDQSVPYQVQGRRFHDLLQRATVPHELFTVPNGGHWPFPLADIQEGFREMQKFLNARDLNAGENTQVPQTE